MAALKPLRVMTPLKEDLLLVRRALITEELGRLSHMQVDLVSLDSRIKLQDVLGKSLTVVIDLADGKPRYFNGIVSRFAQLGGVGRYTEYRADIRPWIWLLTRTADCRIYPDPKETRAATVPDIVKTVFRLHGLTDFEDALKGTYQPREYCVQYRESDFAFVSRLMEEEGIYYYVRHEEDKHFIVLADGPDSHEPPGCGEVPFFTSAERSLSRLDHFDTWALTHEVKTGAYELSDYDFEVPRADQRVKKQAESRGHPYGDLAMFEPGFFVGAYKAAGEEGDGAAADRAQAFVRTRLEEFQAGAERIEGGGNVRALATGALVTLTEHQRPDQNRDYLVTSVQHEFNVGGYEGIEDDADLPLCRCNCVAIPAKVPFRPRRITPRPTIAGHQTATVVGKDGEDIWTDLHGRVKVQFHWDRYGVRDEDSSCWVRVTQAWAGKNWGSIHIPRVGQEVIVAFEDGDPDRPMIIGRLYNGPNKVPYDLSANQTQSGIKSRSTKDGGPANFNEIRFEDKKGEEELYLHAEKNQTIMVENDKGQTVGHDEALEVKNNRTKTVGVDQSESIGSNKKIEVGKNHEETIGVDKTLKVGSNHSEDVGSNMTITVGQSLTETVMLNYAETVGVAMELTVGAAMAQTVGGGLTQIVGKDKSETIGGGKSLKVGKDKSETVGGNKTISVEGNLDLTVKGQKGEKITKEFVLSAKKISITAEEEIAIVTGDAKIILKKNGDIMIQGKDIGLKGSGKISGKADTDMVLKGGSKVTIN